jgi:hypothetical protein
MVGLVAHPCILFVVGGFCGAVIPFIPPGLLKNYPSGILSKKNDFITCCNLIYIIIQL